MEQTYCIVDKRKTPSTDPKGYQRDKRGRLQFYCKCAVCGNKTVRYVKNSGQVGSEKKKKNQKKVKKLNSPSEGAGVFDTVLGKAVDRFVEYGLPWMGRKAVEMGRYGASELMRNKKLQKKAVNYGINKLTPLIQDSLGSAMDQLSKKVRPKKRYKTDRPELDGGSNRSFLWTGRW